MFPFKDSLQIKVDKIALGFWVDLSDCEVTFIFFWMRDSKASCAKTGKRFEAFRPSFCQEAPEKNRERTKRAFRHLDE
jgi:hypothetical protein